MFTEDKFTEIFFMADEFHKVFCRMLDKYSLNAPPKKNDRKDASRSSSGHIPLCLRRSGKREMAFPQTLAVSGQA